MQVAPVTVEQSSYYTTLALIYSHFRVGKYYGPLSTNREMLSLESLYKCWGLKVDITVALKIFSAMVFNEKTLQSFIPFATAVYRTHIIQ